MSNQLPRQTHEPAAEYPQEGKEYVASSPDDDKEELDRFHDKYKHENGDLDTQHLSVRSARRRRLLKRRIREAKMKALLPQPWKLANPGPIGLLGFGMTTILLNLHNTGHFPLYSAIPAMGICFGGGTQLIAGLLEFCKGNTFGCVAFTSYGAFWLSLVCIWMLPNASIGGPPNVLATAEYYLGMYLIIWGLFSTMMLFCTLRLNVAIFLVFFTLVLLFFVLGGSHMAHNEDGVKAAGYIGLICGSLALYLAFAEVLNEVWDCVILPVFPATQVLGWFGAGKDDKEDATAASTTEMQ